MDFLRHIEEDLRSLSYETKKKHPMIKEAAEKAIVHLRTVREQYAHAVRVEAAPGPGHAIFKSRDLLRPFLLACNHLQVSTKTVLTSLASIQRLITWNALFVPEDVRSIMRVLMIQAEGNTTIDVQLKVLQALLLLLTTYAPPKYYIEDDVMAQALWVCLHLHGGGRATSALQSTAAATIGQVVLMAFEVSPSGSNTYPSTTDDKDTTESSAMRSIASLQLPADLSPSRRCSYLVFQDLCRMCRGDSMLWLRGKIESSQELGLELIEAIMAEHRKLFQESPPFTAMVREQICPLVISTLSMAAQLGSSAYSSVPTPLAGANPGHFSNDVPGALSGDSDLPFSLLVRIMRLCSILLKDFSISLQPQAEALLSSLLDIVASGVQSDYPSTFVSHDEGASKSSTPTSFMGLRKSESHSTSVNTNVPATMRHFNLVPWTVLLSLEVINRYLLSTDAVKVLYLQHEGSNLGMDNLPGSASKIPRRRSSRTRSRMFGQMCRIIASFVATSPQCDYTNPSPSGRVLSGLELLSDEHAPVQPKFSAIRTALVALANLADSIDNIATESLETNDGFGLQQMIKLTATSILSALASTLSFSEDAELVSSVIRTYYMLAKCGGRPGVDLYDIRDAAVNALAHFAYPSHPMDRIHGRHIQIIKAIFNLAHALGSQPEFPWKVVLRSFQVLHYFVQNRQKKANGNEDMEQQLNMLGTTLQDFFFTSTRGMSDETLFSLIAAMSDLSLDSLGLPSTKASTRYHRKKYQDGQNAAPNSSSRKLPDRLAKKLANAAALTEIDESTSEDDRIISTELESLDELPSLGDASMQAYNRLFEDDMPSFLMKKLVDTMRLNMIRQNVICWDLITEYLVLISETKDPRVRAFGCESLIQLIISALSCRLEVNILGDVPPPPMSMGSQPKEDRGIPLQGAQLFPVEKLMQPIKKLVASKYRDSAEKVLMGYYDLLQSCGQMLEESWPCAIQILEIVAVLSTENDDSKSTKQQNTVASNAAGGRHAPVHIGFKCVRLLLDDYLDTIRGKAFKDNLLPCLKSYALQSEDVNISLTAINELWTMSDYIDNRLDGSDHMVKMDMWKALFLQFKRIALDRRAEVRNCAINTFFSTAITHGGNFDSEMWKFCLLDTMLELSMTLVSLADTCEAENAKEPIVVVHHSRNTIQKQFSETNVLMLDGSSRVLRTFVSSLIELDWFPGAWGKIMHLATHVALAHPKSRKEVALAGIHTIRNLMQMVCTRGPQHSQQPARVNAGMRVVDGALVSVGGVSKPPNDKKSKVHDTHRPQYWEIAFKELDQACRRVLLKDFTNLPEAIDHAEYTLTDDDEIELAKAFIESLIEVYQNSKDHEFSQPQYFEQLTQLFRDVLNDCVQKSKPSKKMKLGGIHSFILRAYRECSPIGNSEICVNILRDLAKYSMCDGTQGIFPYFIRDVLETITVMYSSDIGTDARVKSFSELLQATQIVVFDHLKGPESAYSHLTTNETRVAGELWKCGVPLLLALIQNGLPALVLAAGSKKPDETLNDAWLGLFKVVEELLQLKISDMPTLIALQVQVIETLVPTVKTILCKNSNATPVWVQDRLVKLLSRGISTADTHGNKVAATCVAELSALCGSSESQSLSKRAQVMLLTNCCEALQMLASDATTKEQLAYAMTTARRLDESNLLATIATASCESDFEETSYNMHRVFNLLCDCITSNNAEVRTLTQRLLRSCGLVELCVSLMKEKIVN